MASYNAGRGGWDDDSGNFIVGSESWGPTNDFSANLGRSGKSGSPAFGLLTAAWGIFDLLPGFIANVVCIIIGIFLKLGIVGKILLTLIAVFVGYFITYATISGIPLGVAGDVAASWLSLTAAAIVGIWYWGYHEMIKQLFDTKMVEIVERCARIIFYGIIVLFIIMSIALAVLGNIFEFKAGNWLYITPPLCISIAAGVYVWNLYAKANAPAGVSAKSKKRIYLIVLSIGVALAIVFSILAIVTDTGGDTGGARALYLIDRDFTKADPDEAIAHYTEVIANNPDSANAYFTRSWFYAKKGDYDRAIEDVTQTIKLAPNTPRAYDNRGWYYSQKGDYDKAIADATQAIKIDRNVANPYDNRGCYYAEKGDYDQALKDLNTALKMEPDDAVFLRNRGSVYYKKGDYDKAIEDYTAALDIDPADKDAKDGLEKAQKARGK